MSDSAIAKIQGIKPQRDDVPVKNSNIGTSKDIAPHHEKPNYSRVTPVIPNDWPKVLKEVALLVLKNDESNDESVVNAAHKKQLKLTQKQGWFSWFGFGRDVNTEGANKLVSWALENGQPIADSNLVTRALEAKYKESQAWYLFSAKANEIRASAKREFDTMVHKLTVKQLQHATENLPDKVRAALTEIRSTATPSESSTSLSGVDEIESQSDMGSESDLSPPKQKSSEVNNSLNRLRTTLATQKIFPEFFRALTEQQTYAFNAYLHSLPDEAGRGSTPWMSIMTQGSREQLNWLSKHNERIADVQKELGKLVSLQEMPQKDKEALALIASNQEVLEKFKKLLTETEEQINSYRKSVRDLPLVGLIAESFRADMVYPQIVDFCNRITNRRFCPNRRFHLEHLGDGLLPRVNSSQAWSNVTWPVLQRRARWLAGGQVPGPNDSSAPFKAVRVLEMRDSISGRVAEERETLDFGNLSYAEFQTVMNALNEGAKGIDRRSTVSFEDFDDSESDSEKKKPVHKIDPLATAVQKALDSIRDQKKKKMIESRIINFINTCDAKITELNMNLNRQFNSEMHPLLLN